MVMDLAGLDAVMAVAPQPARVGEAARHSIQAHHAPLIQGGGRGDYAYEMHPKESRKIGTYTYRHFAAGAIIWSHNCLSMS
jgi:hypothetical protein